MPSLSFGKAMTANELGWNPLSGWQFEYLPWPAAVKLLLAATDANTRITMYSGSQTIQERSPITGAGTAGYTPAELTTPPMVFIGAAGDRLKMAVDEVAGGTPTVDGLIVIEPL